jgi:hypothetical protein
VFIAYGQTAFLNYLRRIVAVENVLFKALSTLKPSY